MESAKNIFSVDENARQRLIEEIGIFASCDHCEASKVNYLILIIDDVITTGSTMRDAVGTLRRAGFKNAYGLSLAH